MLRSVLLGLGGEGHRVCVCVYVCVCYSVVFNSLRPHGLQPSSLFCPWDQKYWSRLPLPSPGDFSDPGIEPSSPPLLANSLPMKTR